MIAPTRNRLLTLGAAWGFLLSIIPALVMSRPLAINAFLAAAVLVAIVSGAVGTLITGGRAAKSTSKKRRGLLSGLKTGAFQGLMSGILAAFGVWVLMALTISEVSLQNPVDISSFMRPAVFFGSFFVALSAFLYVIVVGTLLGPLFGALIYKIVDNRRASVEDKDVR